jgi:DNA repair exonuclease SbcCD ATPase subunit
MIPLRISLKNFLTYRGEHTFDFDGASLWVLSGANGSGKSALFDAITFALYGRHRDNNKANENTKALINHKEDMLSVKFDFRLDGIDYRIYRTVLRQGRSIRQVYYLNCSDKIATHEEPVPDTDRESGFQNWVESNIGLNYNTFTSSILLLQGQSTKLLDPGTDRLQVLKQLVNLDVYERFHQLADERSKEHKARAKELENQLQTLPFVDQTEIGQAQGASEDIQKQWEKAKTEIETLAIVLQQSKQWQQKQEELKQLQAQLQEKYQLRDRASEIEMSYERLQDLSRVLPILTSLTKNRSRVLAYQQEIEALATQTKQLENQVTSAEEIRQGEESKVAELTNRVEQLQVQKQELTQKLLELAPIATNLSEIRQTQAEINLLSEQIGQIPDGLQAIIEAAEKRERYLQEVEKVLPRLKQLTSAHSSLSNSWDSGLLAAKESETLQKQLQECRTQREFFAKTVEEAQAVERVCAQDCDRTEHRYGELCQKLQYFSDAALKPTCELCGQEISSEHIAQEKANLQQQITTTHADLDDLRYKHQAIQENLKQAKAKLESLDIQIENLIQQHHAAEITRTELRLEVKQYIQQIQNAFDYLPEIYQAPIALERPSDPKGWLSITAPSADKLRTLEQENAIREESTEELTRLQNQLKNWQQWSSQQEQAHERLTRLLSNLTIEEAEEACNQKINLEQEFQQVEIQFEHCRKELNSTKEKTQEAQQRIRDLRDQKEIFRAELLEKAATQKEIQNTIEADYERLKNNWRQLAEQLNVTQIEELEAERDRLTQFDTLWLELRSTNQLIDQLNQQIGCIQAELTMIPAIAQRAETEVQQELHTANAHFSSIDRQRLDAINYFERLKRDQKQRLNLEQVQLQAERQYQLYKHLAQLLGPKGLQLHLLRQAERAIVELANETLDSLSRRRLRLELRNDCNDEAQAERVLDLVVYDSKTGSTATAIALTSGSQRFRIAVSLALAIGRYSGQEARRIESVIIDEGFGGLDKNGRDDMIQELSELQQQLKRIILVSHQEEFASAFTNGYFIELVDGSSQISKLIP